MTEESNIHTMYFSVMDIVTWFMGLGDKLDTDQYAFLPKSSITISVKINGSVADLPLPKKMIELANGYDITIRHAIDNRIDPESETVHFEVSGLEENMVLFRLSWDDDWGVLYG